MKNTPEFIIMKGQLAENNYKGFKKQKWVFNAFPNCYYISKLLIHLYSCFVIHFKIDFLIRSCSLFLQQMILELKAFHCISKIFSLSPCYTVLSFCYNIKLCPLFLKLVTCQVNVKEVAVCHNKSYSCLHMLPIARKCTNILKMSKSHYNKRGCCLIKILQLTRALPGFLCHLNAIWCVLLVIHGIIVRNKANYVQLFLK